MKPWMQRLMLGLMWVCARLPLPWVRALGRLMGLTLHALARSRRRVARTNWRLCFPQQSDDEVARAVRQHFICFGQAWLDRGWLWGAPRHVVAQRVQLVGAVEALAGEAPVVVFGPHFVGLDAAWMALTLHLPRTCCGLYAPQNDKLIDHWMAVGRQRFGQPLVIAKDQGLKPLASAMRSGKPLYLLPDMDHGLGDAVWATFFGVPAATLTSLPRLAALGRARVVAVRAELTPQGYRVHVSPAWDDYPGTHLEADVQRMNHELQRMVLTQPEQYFWVHKRFKTRPAGQPSVYR